MYSHKLSDVPVDVWNQHLITRLEKEDCYSLRVVNKEIKNVISHTLLGGFIQKISNLLPSPHTQWVLKQDCGIFSEKLCLNIILTGIGASFVNGAMTGCCLKEFRIWYPLMTGAWFGIAGLCIAMTPLAFFSCIGVLVSMLGDRKAADEALNVGGMFATFAAGLFAMCSTHTLQYELTAVNSTFSVNAQNSTLGDLARTNVAGVNLLTGILTTVEALPLAVWTGFHLYRLFKQETVDIHKDKKSSLIREMKNAM
jgi:hypothetical protein